ncbi:MAG: Gfo/Idh/MocA family oxidoreductase [Chlamydiota bacterium]
MEKIKMGILGAGSFVQRRILPILPKVPTIQPICIFNRSLEKAEKIANQFAVPYAVSSKEELLRHPEVDAIFIATPNHCHEEDAIACAKAKKPVLCEKPLAPTVKAIMRMQESFSQTATMLLVGQSLRFKPAIQKAKQFIAEKELGELLHVRAYFSLFVPKNNWRYNKRSGGGVLQDIGVHLIDLIRFITGSEIEAIYAIADAEESSQCDTTVTAIGKLQCGADYTFECSMDQPLRSGFEIIGSKARLISSNSLRQTYDPGETLCLVREDDSVTYFPLRAKDIYEAELAHFGAVLQQKEASFLDSKEGLANQMVIEAAYASIFDKSPQKIGKVFTEQCY